VAKAAILGDLVITEVAPKGYDNIAYSDKYEFIEIYNRSGAPIDLKNYKIVYDADYSAGYSYTISNSIIVPASGTVVVNTRAKDMTSFKTQWTTKGADASTIDATTYYTNTSDSYNSIKDAGGNISIKDASAVLLYTVTYTSTDVLDYTSIKYDYDAANPGIGQNKRAKQVANPGKIDEGQVAAPTKPIINVNGLNGGDNFVDPYTVNVSVNDPQDGVIDVSSSSVTITLDGNTITNGTVIPMVQGVNTPHNLVVSATDLDGNTSTKTITFTMGAYIKPARAIADGTIVTVAGYVSNKIDANTFYLQDETGGLKVYKNYSNIASTLNVGDRILMSGKIQTSNKIKQLYDTLTILKTYSTGNTVSPKVLTLNDIVSQTEATGNEPYECKLVQINNLTVTNVKTFVKISFTDGTNTIDTSNALSSTIPTGMQNGSTVNIKGILVQDAVSGKYQIYVSNFTTDVVVGPTVTVNGLNYDGETVESYKVDVQSNASGVAITLDDTPVQNGDVIGVPGNYILKAVATLNGITAEKITHFTVGVPNYSIASAKAGSLDTYVKIKGIINATEPSIIYIQDDDAAIPVQISSTGYAIGNEVIVTGVIKSVSPGYGAPVTKIYTDVKVTKVAESKELLPKQITINDYLTSYNNYSYMKLKFSNVRLEMNTADTKYLSKIKDNSGANNSEVSLSNYGGLIGTTFITGNYADVVALASDSTHVDIKNASDVTKIVYNSALSKDKADFDIYSQGTNYKDITVDITTNGNVLKTITNNTTPLLANTDYMVSGNTVTIKKEYLVKQQKGDAVLSFNFSDGTPSTLTINVADTTPQNSEVTAANTDFDIYSQSSKFVDITADINYKGNSLVSIKNGENVLELDKDYTKTIDTVVISKNYLKTQAVGDVVLTFIFNAGNTATLTLKVIDTTPVIVPPSVEKVMVGANELTEAQTGILLNAKFDITFNKELDTSTIGSGANANIYVTKNSDGIRDSNSFSYTITNALVGGKTIVSIEPALFSSWDDTTTYYIVVSNAVKDKDGNASVPFKRSFATKVISALNVTKSSVIKADDSELAIVSSSSNTIASNSKKIEITFDQNILGDPADALVEFKDTTGTLAQPVNGVVVTYSQNKVVVTLPILKDNAKYRLYVYSGLQGANDSANKSDIIYNFNTPLAEYQKPHLESVLAGTVQLVNNGVAVINKSTSALTINFDKLIDATTLKKSFTYNLYVTKVKGSILSSNIMTSAITPLTGSGKTFTMNLKALDYGATYYLEVITSTTNFINTPSPNPVSMNPISIEFKVEDQKSVNARLSNLTIDGNTVANFNADTLEYNVEVKNATAIPQVDATVEDEKATKVITQATAVPGTATVVVTAEDTTVTKTYTINFKLAVQKSTNANLKNLIVDGTTIANFNADTTEYNVELINTKPVPQIAADLDDSKATILVTQATSVPGIATVVVTAEDTNISKTYKVNFKLLPPAKIITTYPIDYSLGFPIDGKPTLTFDKDMDDNTINNTTIQLGTGPSWSFIPLSEGWDVQYDYPTKKATIIPKSLLAKNTNYTIKVSYDKISAKDGTKLGYTSSVSFTTGSGDSTPLSAVNTTPAKDATNVSIREKLSISFNKVIASGQNLGNFVTIIEDLTNNPVTFSAGKDTTGKILKIDLGANKYWKNGTKYNVTVSKELVSEDGNKMESNFNFSFTTEAFVPLTVVNTIPVNSAEDITLKPIVKIEFSEAIFEALATDWFTVTNTKTNEVLTSDFYGLCVSMGSQFMTINFAKDLDYDTTYTVNVKKGINNEFEDKALESDFSFSFKTVKETVVVAPKVTSTYPENGVLGFPMEGKPTITFDQEMDTTTINNTNIKIGTGYGLTFKALEAGWNVEYDAATKTATIIPKAKLAAVTDYTVVLDYTNIKGINGVNLAFISDVNFTTNSEDTAPLGVVTTLPADNSENVSIYHKITINFSKELAPGQNYSNLVKVIKEDSEVRENISATKENNNKTLVIYLSSNADFAYNTKYLVTVDNTLLSRDGTKLANDFNFSFTTEKIVSLSAINSSPNDKATNVPVNQEIKIEFSENIYEPLATEWFTIKNNATGEILGSNYFGLCSASGSKFLTIKLAKNLDYETSYTVTVKKGLGNEKENKTLENDYSFSFTTAVKVEEKSNDATLKTIKIAGKELFDFNPNVLAYNVEVSGALTTPPTVTVEANSSKATITKIDATTIPGTTRITVKAEDGTEKTYLVNFAVNLIIENKTTKTEFKLGEDAGITIKASNLSNVSRSVNLIVALFDGNKFISYVSAKQEVNAMDSNTITATFKIPKTGRYTIKAFIWDDLVNMNALSRVIEIPVSE
jgi:methionine-rich copper-binding protein CopC/uncharacterized protein YdeI (BOF family)